MNSPCHPSTTLFLNENLDHVFSQLKCVAKVNLAFGFVLKNFEAERVAAFVYTDTIRLWERSKLVCTENDVNNMEKNWRKRMLLIIAQKKERTLREKITNLQLLQFLLRYSKINPWVVKQTVISKLLWKNHHKNFLTFERNTRLPYNDNICLFRALALHLHVNDKLEGETAKTFNLFLAITEEGDTPKFQSVQLINIPEVEDTLHLNIFL